MQARPLSRQYHRLLLGREVDERHDQELWPGTVKFAPNLARALVVKLAKATERADCSVGPNALTVIQPRHGLVCAAAEDAQAAMASVATAIKLHDRMGRPMSESGSVVVMALPFIGISISGVWRTLAFERAARGASPELCKSD